MKTPADLAAEKELDQLIANAPRFSDANGLHWPDRILKNGKTAAIRCVACQKDWGDGSYRVGIERYIEIHKDMK